MIEKLSGVFLVNLRYERQILNLNMLSCVSSQIEDSYTFQF